MSDLLTATLYPGICLLEGTNISDGRGTDTPFQIFGAPWTDGTPVNSTVEFNKTARNNVRRQSTLADRAL